MISLLLHAIVSLSTPVTLPAPPAQDGEQEPVWTQAKLERTTERIRGQIEELRGEEFLRPVEVRLTDGPGFVRHMTERVETMLPEGELETEESVAKLLGLVPPDMDLWQVTQDMLEEQVGGFYDPSADTFYLMESFAGGLAEIILAHELTHALDDQLYDIDGKLETLLENGDATSAYQAVVEGSGTSLMTTWMLKHGSALSPAELEQAMSMGQGGLDEAPAYVWKPLLHAYLGGQKFLSRGYRLRDKKAGEELSDVIRKAFQDPPRSTEQVLHPDKYWKASERDDPRVVRQEAGELPGGWEVVGERVLGELTLAILAEDPEAAAALDLSNPVTMTFMKYTNDAAEGWGGDSLLYLQKDGAGLVRLVTVWDRPEDAAEFRAAIERGREAWAGRLAGLDTADAGSGLALEPGAAEDQLVLLAWAGSTEEDARAVSRAVTTRELEPAPAGTPGETPDGPGR